MIMTKSQQKQIDNLQRNQIKVVRIDLKEGDITTSLRELMNYPEVTNIFCNVEYGYCESDTDDYSLTAFRIETWPEFEARKNELIRKYQEENKQKSLASKINKQKREEEERTTYLKLKGKFEK